MARTFEFVLQFVGCVTVTVSPNQIIIIIIIIIIKAAKFWHIFGASNLENRGKEAASN